MKLDDTGRHAASVLEHEVHQQLDTARSLRELYETVERPRRVRRRPKPLLVAFVSVIVVAAIAVLVGETRTSHAPSSAIPETIYAYLPDVLPRGMHAIEGGVVANQGPLPPGDPRGVTYGAYFGARPTLSVTTWTQSPPLGSVAAPAAAVDIRGHHGQLFSTRDWLGVTTYDLWWQEGSYTLQVEAFGLPLSHLRRFAASLRPIDQRHFRAAAHGIATPPTVGLSTPSFSVDDPSGPGKTLATYPDTANGTYAISLGTFHHQRRRWLCASFDQHGNNEESSAPEGVDATGGFPFPSLLRSPTYRAFLIGSLPRTARSLTVTLDNGQTLPATLHDTGIGNHPIFSFVNLGTPTSETITGTITVTGETGKTIKHQHFKFGLRA
jgi:hypothetical protein